MTKPRSINLKNIALGWFLLFYVLAPLKNIATSSNIINEETIYSITDSSYNIESVNSWCASHFATRNYIILRTNAYTLCTISDSLKKYYILKILSFIYSLLFITDSTRISLYNYFTGHNKRKQGWYHGKFFVYFGKKANITKNFHLDLYFSLLNFCVNLFECLYITRDLLFLILKTISSDINIRIYKNFFFCFKPMSLIRICILYIKRYLVRIKTTEYLLNNFPQDLPQNFNFDNIHCLRRRS